jgi:hypothetical protein
MYHYFCNLIGNEIGNCFSDETSISINIEKNKATILSMSATLDESVNWVKVARDYIEKISSNFLKSTNNTLG